MFWNVLAFIMVGITLLYACDSIQINNLEERGMHSDTFAEDVVFKRKPSSIDPAAAPGATSTASTPDTKPDANSDVSSPAPDKQSKVEHDHGFDRRYPSFVSVMKNGDVEYFTYTPRGRSMEDVEKQALVNQWGQWNFNGQRSLLSEDFYQKYPNRDVPRNEFPAKAWQTDREYLSGFLPEALALVQRAQDAILAEYGQPSTGSWEDRTQMFAIDRYPENLEGVELTDKKGKAIVKDNGGWTTPESWAGLKRRLLHAIMTEDSFVFAMGGHSSSAGHGNHLQQSYTLMVSWVLQPVLARLGVRHQARNFGNGGMGTVHNGMGSGSVYGPDIGKIWTKFLCCVERVIHI
jgi:hypothetical protein